MGNSRQWPIARFEDFEVNLETGEVWKAGRPLKVQDQPFKILTALLERPGQIVTREELRQLIWPDKDFGDFDHAINLALAKLRATLGDSAEVPHLIETLPRRGYRFIAPVTAHTPAEASSAIRTPLIRQVDIAAGDRSGPGVPTEITGLELGSVRAGSRARTTTIILVSIAGVLAVAAVTALMWTQSRSNTLPATTFVTSAAQCCARLTRDGKLLAYVSPDGPGPPQIWVQQTGGGDAIQVTKGPDGVIGPDFSPDGTHLVFVCKQGLCTAPTLSGTPKVVLKGAHAGYPVYSPDGLKILYLDGTENRAMTVFVNGGEPASLDLNREFLVRGPPIWSPDGNQILFYGTRKGAAGKPDGWWIAPLPAGGPTPLALPDMEKVVGDREIAARAWLRKKDGTEWIVYTAQEAGVWKMFRIPVSKQGEIRGAPVQITFGVGEIGYSVSVAEDGKVAYPTFTSRQTTFAIPIDSRGQKSGPVSEVLLSPGTDSYSPSISRDGRSMAYVEDTPGKSNNVVLTDLKSGKGHIVDEATRRSNYSVGIAPDGSKVSFEQDCGNRRWQSGEAVNCGFVSSPEGERPRKVCESCIPRGFSSDGSILLVRKYNPIRDDKPPGWIAGLDLRSGSEKQLVASPNSAIESASLSWNDRWIIFVKILDRTKSQIMIAPVRDGTAGKEPEWIAVTDGTHNDGGPQFSSDGTMAYFMSKRDGYDCIWGQRLDPATKRPIGEAFGFEHFHDASQKDLDGYWNGDDADLSVARDKIIASLVQWHVGIWMTQIQ
jgi:Tol biopolymer transport system component/DNA-binding winged helix-turn-helix (wHTH) protein